MLRSHRLGKLARLAPALVAVAVLLLEAVPAHASTYAMDVDSVTNQITCTHNPGTDCDTPGLSIIN